MYDKQLHALGRLLEIMDRLRRDCPWDREQTFASLRNNTIEETFELTDAITDGDMDSIREELGDLLLHIVFYSKMGDEQGAFDLGDVADAVCDKLVYRHPHVFGNVEADTSGDVIRNWETLKIAEKKKKERKGRGGVLSGVPRSLPAMVKALRVGEKAAAAGFDWEAREDVWQKVHEEVAEVEAEITSGDRERMEEEVGDLFFALVNMSRLYEIDPEAALEKANRKFMRRFSHVEARADEAETSLRDASAETKDEWWREAKDKEKR